MSNIYDNNKPITLLAAQRVQIGKGVLNNTKLLKRYSRLDLIDVHDHTKNVLIRKLPTIIRAKFEESTPPFKLAFTSNDNALRCHYIWNNRALGYFGVLLDDDGNYMVSYDTPNVTPVEMFRPDGSSYTVNKITPAVNGFDMNSIPNLPFGVTSFYYDYTAKWMIAITKREDNNQLELRILPLNGNDQERIQQLERHLNQLIQPTTSVTDGDDKRYLIDVEFADIYSTVMHYNPPVNKDGLNTSWNAGIFDKIAMYDTREEAKTKD